ncbi:hypothetical protein KC19_10G015000 [Ceratodon purpureus]|uniref:Uncharacterized protein n=1 Tax=Ceratodon purpureus TaxID=3225 RepID=A0A8T0GGX4_CERPU|nr:hypothetical protein KC19_10G015000 [Ceratodon purpureus]
MRKRERENPCFVCGHYHKFEDGEVCGICGHRLQEAAEKGPQQSAFSSEILPQFLYLGSYDNASRAELLKAQNISRILNTVPTCQNLYKNSFTYHSLKEDKSLPFTECLEFIEQARADKARVLVHCMSGQSRSPAVVIAYLMKYKQWRLPQAYQWVKDRRPSINLTEGTGVEHDALADVGCGSCGVVMRLSQLMVWSSETLLLRANRNVRGLVLLWRCVFMV